MSFEISLYSVKAPTNRLRKYLGAPIDTIEGTLKDESSIMNPIILIESGANRLRNCNYIHIPVWGRYYYINDIVSVRAGIWEIRAHVDVLMTYADEISNCTGIIEKSQGTYNLLLNDGSLRVYQNPYVTTTPFPSGFPDSSWSYVLGVSGS